MACLIPTFLLLNTKDYMTHCSSHCYYNYYKDKKSLIIVKLFFFGTPSRTRTDISITDVTA